MVEGIGLRTFPVTSGNKGIHLYVPLDKALSPGGASTVAKQVATNLEKLHPELVTATMAKNVRADKVFLDWSQNNPAKTTIAPYSLRGRDAPTVAAPRSWSEIESRKKLRHLRFDEVLARFSDDGDLLADLDPPLAVPTGDALAKYRSMRDPERTPEPVPATPPAATDGNRFVVQEHHARRLHWDVRLERDGVLASWAVPKGPPTSSDQNRLAVHTEDHPLEYLHFHGAIPKGQYGAGEMTIWDTGTYETEKWRDDEVIVRFHGERLNGRFALIQTNGNQWLMHLMREQHPDDAPEDAAAQPKGVRPEQVSRRASAALPRGLEPMLATEGEVSDLDDNEWSFETKWDGFRLIAEISSGTLTLRSRRGIVVTGRYPGIGPIADELSGHDVVLDGEAVVFDDHGVAQLGRRQADAARAVFVAFDVLYLDGTSLVRKRYADRRRVLEALAGTAPSMRVPPRLDGPGSAALRYSQDQGLEGVVAKRKDSVYLPGKRGHSWIKQRNWRTLAVVVGGYRRSEARSFKSLLVGIPHDDRLIYVGRVGTGFGDEIMRDLAARLHKLERKTSPFDNTLAAEERKEAVWVTPKIVGVVRFMNWTETGRLWHPAWLGEE
jgi:bifunctional non-homologous end joining protein LigD